MKRNWFRPVCFALALIPFLALVYSVINGTAGPNPIEAIEKQTGEWTLRFFLLSLMATPLTEIFKIAWPVRLRRMVGLFAFFYATAHLLAYALLDQSLVLADIVADIVEKPYITAGFAAFLIMLPLAATSNRFFVKRLAGRWKALHRWVYVAGVFGLLHYVWLAKGERTEPLVYLAVLLLLLAYRLVKILSPGKAATSWATST